MLVAGTSTTTLSKTPVANVLVVALVTARPTYSVGALSVIVLIVAHVTPSLDCDDVTSEPRRSSRTQ